MSEGVISESGRVRRGGGAMCERGGFFAWWSSIRDRGIPTARMRPIIDIPNPNDDSKVRRTSKMSNMRVNKR